MKDESEATPVLCRGQPQSERGAGSAVVVLTEALARGGKVVWDHPERPRLLAPPSLHDAIKTDRATVKEILRRAAIF